jgi:hypothetical protein
VWDAVDYRVDFVLWLFERRCGCGRNWRRHRSCRGWLGRLCRLLCLLLLGCLLALPVLFHLPPATASQAQPSVGAVCDLTLSR